MAGAAQQTVRKSRIEIVRSAEACVVDASLVCEHLFFARQLVGLCRGGQNSLEARKVPCDDSGLFGCVGWMNARRHVDNNGVLYLMPIVAAASKLTVGRDSVLLRVGEVIRFKDKVVHRTTDSTPAMALIYEDGAKKTPVDEVLRRFDKLVTKISRDVIDTARRIGEEVTEAAVEASNSDGGAVCMASGTV